MDNEIEFEDQKWLNQQRVSANPQRQLSGVTQSESSMRAPDAEQNSLLKKLTEKHRAQLQVKGHSAILEEIKKYLKEQIIKNPPKDSRGIPLPPRLELDENLSEAERIPYYKDPVHSAWRYLQNPNPWMDKDARYVGGNPNDRSGFAKRNPEDENRMDLIWLEISSNANSDDLKLLFANRLADIGRAHNWDDTARVKRENPKMEFYGDLQGDKPSCNVGVSLRLLQALIGTEIAEAPALSGQLIQGQLMDLLQKKFKENIKYASEDEITELEKIFESKIILLNDLSEDEQIKFDRFNLTHHEIVEFLRESATKYGSEIFKEQVVRVGDEKPFKSIDEYFIKAGVNANFQTKSYDNAINLLAARRKELKIEATNNEAIEQHMNSLENRQAKDKFFNFIRKSLKQEISKKIQKLNIAEIQKLQSIYEKLISGQKLTPLEKSLFNNICPSNEYFQKAARDSGVDKTFGEASIDGKKFNTYSACFFEILKSNDMKVFTTDALKANLVNKKVIADQIIKKVNKEIDKQITKSSITIEETEKLLLIFQKLSSRVKLDFSENNLLHKIKVPLGNIKSIANYFKIKKVPKEIALGEKEFIVKKLEEKKISLWNSMFQQLNITDENVKNYLKTSTHNFSEGIKSVFDDNFIKQYCTKRPVFWFNPVTWFQRIYDWSTGINDRKDLIKSKIDIIKSGGSIIDKVIATRTLEMTIKVDHPTFVVATAISTKINSVFQLREVKNLQAGKIKRSERKRNLLVPGFKASETGSALEALPNNDNDIKVRSEQENNQPGKPQKGPSIVP